MLNGYLKQMKDNHGPPLVIETDDGPLFWNRADIAEARQLCQILQSPPEGGLDDLIGFYRQVTSRLRQPEGKLSAIPVGSQRTGSKLQGGVTQDADMTVHPV